MLIRSQSPSFWGNARLPALGRVAAVALLVQGPTFLPKSFEKVVASVSDAPPRHFGVRQNQNQNELYSKVCLVKPGNNGGELHCTS